MDADSAEWLLQEGCLPIPEACAFSGLKRSKLYALMDQGRLAYVKLDGARRIPKRALIALLASCLVMRNEGA